MLYYLQQNTSDLVTTIAGCQVETVTCNVRLWLRQQSPDLLTTQN